MKRQDEQFLQDIFDKTEEKEKNFRLAGVLQRETPPEQDFFSLLWGILRQAGVRGLFTQMGDVIFLSFVVTILCFWGIYVALGQDTEQLPGAVFVSAPILYGMVFVLSWLKEVQNGTFYIQMSYRNTFFHILAVRMFGSSLIGLLVNGVYAAFLALCCDVDGIRIFAVSFTSLMFFSAILLAGLRKGGRVWKGLAAGGAWMGLQLAASALMKSWYQRLLAAVPLYVLLAAGIVILIIYLRELGQISGVRFRKEFADALY